MADEILNNFGFSVHDIMQQSNIIYLKIILNEAHVFIL